MRLAVIAFSGTGDLAAAMTRPSSRHPWAPLVCAGVVTPRRTRNRSGTDPKTATHRIQWPTTFSEPAIMARSVLERYASLPCQAVYENHR